MRDERKALITPIAEKVSKLKRDHLGAPIRSAMLKALKGEKFDCCEVPYRQEEKYWVIQPEEAKDEVMVVFEVNFNKSNNPKSRDGGKLDFAIARVLLIEFKNIA